MLAQTESLCSLNVKPAQVLLLFQRGGSLDIYGCPAESYPEARMLRVVATWLLQLRRNSSNRGDAG